MSTTSRGNQFENLIAELLTSEIDANRFWAKRECCRLFKKKAYHSRDRQREIVFDISIEVSLPGAASPSLIVLVECKNYANRAISVEEVEEFFAKVEQVAAANGKAIMAAKTGFQESALAFAKSKKMGLMRYFSPENFKWELNRSPSACLQPNNVENEFRVREGLTNVDYVSTDFDLFIQTPTTATNSLLRLFDDLSAGALSSNLARRIQNNRANRNSVARLGRAKIEIVAEGLLNAVSYTRGIVSLDSVCEVKKTQVGLSVEKGVEVPAELRSRGALGRIQFDPLRIQIFAQVENHDGRNRFTLAHELGHLCLGHGAYMRREYFDSSDLERGGAPFQHKESDVDLLERQANYFAASLLMPRVNVLRDFNSLVAALNIEDRGYGPLFVDEQRCNVDNFMTVTNSLKQRYGVSRSAIAIRLKSLNLLRDVRGVKRIDSILS